MVTFNNVLSSIKYGIKLHQDFSGETANHSEALFNKTKQDLQFEVLAYMNDYVLVLKVKKTAVTLGVILLS